MKKRIDLVQCTTNFESDCSCEFLFFKDLKIKNEKYTGLLFEVMTSRQQWSSFKEIDLGIKQNKNDRVYHASNNSGKQEN